VGNQKKHKSKEFIFTYETRDISETDVLTELLCTIDVEDYVITTSEESITVYIKTKKLQKIDNGDLFHLKFGDKVYKPRLMETGDKKKMVRICANQRFITNIPEFAKRMEEIKKQLKLSISVQRKKLQKKKNDNK
jgi:hypothetical protein